MKSKWAIMTGLQRLKSIIQQGFLLTSQTEETNLRDAITTLEREITPITSDIDDYLFRMIRTRQILRDQPQDPILKQIYNQLRQLFNKQLNIFNEHYFEKIKHHNQHEFDEADKLLELETTVKHNEISTTALTHRISLIKSYKRLSEHCLEHKNAFDEIKRILASHAEHTNATNGLHLIEKQTDALTAHINLRRALQMVWSLIPKDADKAKRKLCENLAILGEQYRHSEQFTDEKGNQNLVAIDKNFFNIKGTKEHENVLRLILEPLCEINHPHVAILNSVDELTSLIKQKCNEHLKDFVAQEPLEEQSKILYHLEKREKPKDHLTFNVYVEETTDLLKEEFSAYDFVHHDIANEIKRHVEECINQKISLQWLRAQTRTGLRSKLETASDPNQKKEALIKLLDTEMLLSSSNKERSALLESLKKRAMLLIPLQKGTNYQTDIFEIDQLHARYKEILLLDEYNKELKAIINAQNQAGKKFLYLDLKTQSERLFKNFSYMHFIKLKNKYEIATLYPAKSRLVEVDGVYQSLVPYNEKVTLIKPGELWVTYHASMPARVSHFKHAIEQLKLRKKALDTRLISEQKKETAFFANIHYPSSYSTLEKNSIRETISAIFKDYADKAHWYYLHAFRNHTKEARELQQSILKCNNTAEMRNYLIAVKDDLMAKGQLNVEGSFSRRIHYCLNLFPKAINDEKPLPPHSPSL